MAAQEDVPAGSSGSYSKTIGVDVQQVSEVNPVVVFEFEFLLLSSFFLERLLLN